MTDSTETSPEPLGARVKKAIRRFKARVDDAVTDAGDAVREVLFPAPPPVPVRVRSRYRRR